MSAGDVVIIGDSRRDWDIVGGGSAGGSRSGGAIVWDIWPGKFHCDSLFKLIIITSGVRSTLRTNTICRDSKEDRSSD